MRDASLDNVSDTSAPCNGPVHPASTIYETNDAGGKELEGLAPLKLFTEQMASQPEENK